MHKRRDHACTEGLQKEAEKQREKQVQLGRSARQESKKQREQCLMMCDQLVELQYQLEITQQELEEMRQDPALPVIHDGSEAESIGRVMQAVLTVRQLAVAEFERSGLKSVAHNNEHW